jgi:hypothetical protein
MEHAKAREKARPDATPFIRENQPDVNRSEELTLI